MWKLETLQLHLHQPCQKPCEAKIYGLIITFNKKKLVTGSKNGFSNLSLLRWDCQQNKKTWHNLLASEFIGKRSFNGFFWDWIYFFLSAVFLSRVAVWDIGGARFGIRNIVISKTQIVRNLKETFWEELTVASGDNIYLLQSFVELTKIKLLKLFQQWRTRRLNAVDTIFNQIPSM